MTTRKLFANFAAVKKECKIVRISNSHRLTYHKRMRIVRWCHEWEGASEENAGPMELRDRSKLPISDTLKSPWMLRPVYMKKIPAESERLCEWPFTLDGPIE